MLDDRGRMSCKDGEEGILRGVVVHETIKKC